MTSHTIVPDHIRRVLRFLVMPSTWIITLLAILGILMGVQSKLPFSLEPGQPRIVQDTARPGTQSVTVKPPVFQYSGPMIFTLVHRAVEADVELNIYSGGEMLSTTIVPAGGEGQKRFYLFPGDFDPSTGVIVDFRADNAPSPADFLHHAIFEFPLVGAWLFPDLLLWTMLVVMAFAFGLICALIWDSAINVAASYAGSVIMLVLACHLFGLEGAWRIANQLLAVLLLLVAVYLLRWLVITRKPVVIKG